MILMALAFAMSPDTRQQPTVGAETRITFAANGGLRDWQAGPPNSSIVYVRDRNEHWYQVTLTGPCVTDTALDSLTYTTDSAGTFDTFSQISVARYPGRVCGVTSVRFSTPPPGQPGAKRK